MSHTDVLPNNEKLIREAIKINCKRKMYKYTKIIMIITIIISIVIIVIINEKENKDYLARRNICDLEDS